MPLIQLPIFPASSTAITSDLAFEQRDGQVYYFNGHLPVFTHPADDIASFRFFTSQLIANKSRVPAPQMGEIWQFLNLTAKAGLEPKPAT